MSVTPISLGSLAQFPAQTDMSQSEIFNEVVMGDSLLASSLYVNIALAGLTLLAIAYIAKDVTDPRAKLIIVSCMMISAVSVSSYTGLFSGMTISMLEMPAGHALGGEEVVSLWGRYLTWAFSTPFILLALGLIAGSNLTKIFTAIVFDVGIMITGLAAALTTSSYVLRWFWYLVSVSFFLVVVYILLVEWPKDAERTGTKGIFSKLKILTVVLWFGYTVWWGVGNEGLALIENVALTSWGYSVFDIFAKYLFTFLVVLYVIDEPEEVTGGDGWGLDI
ncbi:bacteriorhodopsin [Haladaptatus sp. F3-133]|uniref:Bacteriorhodopsin n=1 Tax=Halorutilus salinus TaxID=2487751 RepID=A0A9Q4GH26_9EURY|nr:bacteriorhodopsin [Halorutilus salinus]MCX2819367.1 bacteriorhodopsin [Halorutilus salinus]